MCGFNIFENLKQYHKKKPLLRYKTTIYDHGRIKRLAITGIYICREIKAKMKVDIGLRQIQRIVGDDEYGRWRKLNNTPVLTKT